MSRSVSVRARDLRQTGVVTLVGAALLALYALFTVWASVTAEVVVARLGYGMTAPTLPGTDLVLTSPYHVMVPVERMPVLARLLIQGSDVLTPVLWAVCVALLGLLQLRAGSSPSVFAPRVLRVVRALSLALVALALVPPLMRMAGGEQLVDSEGWDVFQSTDRAAIFVPFAAAYLCAAFDVVLRRGAALQAELDEVI